MAELDASVTVAWSTVMVLVRVMVLVEVIVVRSSCATAASGSRSAATIVGRCIAA